MVTTTEVSSLFSRPEFDQRVGNSWQRILRGGESSPEDTIRILVEDSWRRCLGTNVDPGISQAQKPIGANHVAELLHSHRDLIEACKPVMTLAQSFLLETGTVMVLTDPRGIVLDVEGDNSALGPAERIHLLPGASWSESECGTNAIGTALATDRPVQIHAEEHFCEGIKRWTCSAAVIHDPVLGEILGVVDVSGLSLSYSRHALSLVVTATNQIESFLAKKEWQLRCQLIERIASSHTTTDGTGEIVFDRHGLPLKLNSSAPALLAWLGASMDMNKPSRIVGLSEAGARTATRQAALPDWLRPEWIEPIIDGGQRVGSVVRIPPRSRKSKSITVATAPVESTVALAFASAKGNSVAIQLAIDKAKRLAPSRVPILLLGETGVGKEVFARGIHAASRGCDGPFVALNCGGLSRDLLASELFGHVDGAFTGARRGGIAGKIEAAEGGTLFLDELGEMPLDLQPSFLRVLEDGQICRLGDTKTRHVRFRLIAATNRDLRQDVTEGRFRMDLFYRISVTNVTIPPLKERSEDIAELVTSFVQQLCAYHETSPKSFDPAAIRYMESYSWPGNIRELKNMVESLVLTVPDDVIGPKDLPPEILATTQIITDSVSVPAGESLSVLARSESEQICKVLQKTSGNATLAAKELGIAKSTLYLKMKKYDLDGSLGSWRTVQ
jgi:transcriptional regulator of acetoin/glycerol metabolism